MAKPDKAPQSETPDKPKDRRPQPFRAPRELAPEFGAQSIEPHNIQGVVLSAFIRALLDAFGLQQRENISMPFHHIEENHGERYSLRIEPAGFHNVDGETVNGHQWIYRRDKPEAVEGS